MSRLDERPWFKFRPDRWLSDVELQSCSLAAQGLWINIISFMHGCAIYGHLLYKGKAAGAAELARMLPRVARAEIDAALSELEAEGVFSRTADGIIFSRRMVRDYAKAKAGKVAKIGGKVAKITDATGDLFDADDLEGDLQGELEGHALEGDLQGTLQGHKKEKEREKKKENLPLKPPSRGATQNKKSKPKAGEAATARPAPSKPNTARRAVHTLPAAWEPEDGARQLAFDELRMTFSEFADAVEDFREWAGKNGRRIRNGAEPNWNSTFRNHLRTFANRIGSARRRDKPAAFAAVAADATKPAEYPGWWLAIKAKFEASDFFASEWPAVWANATPIKEAPCVVRMRSQADWALLRSSPSVERFEEVCGFSVTALPPEKVLAR